MGSCTSLLQCIRFDVDPDPNPTFHADADPAPNPDPDRKFLAILRENIYLQNLPTIFSKSCKTCHV